MSNKYIKLLTFLHNINNAVIEKVHAWADDVKNPGLIADNGTNIGD
jgi:hypothetical protein